MEAIVSSDDCRPPITAAWVAASVLPDYAWRSHAATAAASHSLGVATRRAVESVVAVPQQQRSAGSLARLLREQSGASWRLRGGLKSPNWRAGCPAASGPKVAVWTEDTSGVGGK